MSTPTGARDAWLDGLAEGVVLIARGRVTRLNDAAARILGADPRRAAGLSPIAVLRDHRLEQVWLEGGARELTVRGRRIEAVRIEGGLALRDVSEARAAQEDARELLAVLSHELRTPVTTVLSTLEALRYEDLPLETRERLLARAASEAERLARLLADLTVDVAPPRERSVSLAEATDRACAVLAERLEEHDVTVVRDVPELSVWADPDKVLQVLVNLIENAAVHGPDGAVVDVDAEASDVWVTLRVRDRGEPLAPARIEALFAPHARGASGKARGTGLGLYIVRSIAERCGGAAWGAPWSGVGPAGPERGNAFAVRLPARRDVAVGAGER